MSKSQQQLTVTLTISKGTNISDVLTAIRATRGVTSAEIATSLADATVGQVIDRVNSLNRNDRDQVSGALCASALRAERIANMARSSQARGPPIRGSTGSRNQKPDKVKQAPKPRELPTKLDIASVSNIDGRKPHEWIGAVNNQLRFLRMNANDPSIRGLSKIEPDNPNLTSEERAALKELLDILARARDFSKKSKGKDPNDPQPSTSWADDDPADNKKQPKTGGSTQPPNVTEKRNGLQGR